MVGEGVERWAGRAHFAVGLRVPVCEVGVGADKRNQRADEDEELHDVLMLLPEIRRESSPQKPFEQGGNKICCSDLDLKLRGDNYLQRHVERADSPSLPNEREQQRSRQ